MFQTRTWNKDTYYDNFKSYWNLHNSIDFIDINYHLGNTIYTGDIVKLTCDNYLLGTKDTSRFTDKSYVLGYVIYSITECRFRIKQFTHGNFYVHDLNSRNKLLELYEKTKDTKYRVESESTKPIYFYESGANGRQLFSFDRLEVIGNVYETKNTYPKEEIRLSWY